jgi:hypothetical protein
MEEEIARHQMIQQKANFYHWEPLQAPSKVHTGSHALVRAVQAPSAFSK